jgi:hypothetical protein
VSVSNNEDVHERDEERIIITIVCFINLAKCIAPSTPI